MKAYELNGDEGLLSKSFEESRNMESVMSMNVIEWSTNTQIPIFGCRVQEMHQLLILIRQTPDSMYLKMPSGFLYRESNILFSLASEFLTFLY